MGDIVFIKEQCKGARAMIGWTVRDLAREAGVSPTTVVDFEKGARSPIQKNLDAIKAALEGGGATFFTFNGTVGVGIKRPAA